MSHQRAPWLIVLCAVAIWLDSLAQFLRAVAKAFSEWRARG